MTAPKTPVLGKTITFHPLAWLQYQWFCHKGPTEVAAYAVATKPMYPLFVTHMCFLKQEAHVAYVEMDDKAVADHLNDWLDRKLHPYQINRIWCHTHPGHTPNPSGTDEETFKRIFQHMDWGVMMILAKGGATYCRLRQALKIDQTTTGPFNVSTSLHTTEVIENELEVQVAWSLLKGKPRINTSRWEETYKNNIIMPSNQKPGHSGQQYLNLERPHRHIQQTQGRGYQPNPKHNWGKARPLVRPGNNVIPPPTIPSNAFPFWPQEFFRSSGDAAVIKALLPFSISIEDFCDMSSSEQKETVRELGVIITP